MGRKIKIDNEFVKSFIGNSYMNGMRVKEIHEILKRDFKIDISERTLFRFIVKNCKSRWAITHPNRKNTINENESEI